MHPAEAMGIFRRAGIKDPEMMRDITIGLVARLIEDDLIVAGDISDSGFMPWPLSKGDSLMRIVHSRIAAPNPFVMPGEVFWLAPTSEGARIGKEVWRREGRV